MKSVAKGGVERIRVLLGQSFPQRDKVRQVKFYAGQNWFFVMAAPPYEFPLRKFLNTLVVAGHDNQAYIHEFS